jgi:hypothetical protein
VNDVSYCWHCVTVAAEPGAVILSQSRAACSVGTQLAVFLSPA